MSGYVYDKTRKAYVKRSSVRKVPVRNHQPTSGIAPWVMLAFIMALVIIVTQQHSAIISLQDQATADRDAKEILSAMEDSGKPLTLVQVHAMQLLDLFADDGKPVKYPCKTC